MKTSLISGVIILLLSLSACQSESDFTNYSAYGVRLSLPEGWKKVEQPILDVGVQILIEKEGEDESGQFVMNILNNKLPLEQQIKDTQAQLSQNFSIQDISFNFAEIKKTSFNKVEALSCKFSHDNGGLDFRGVLVAFHCGEKTVSIFIQEEQEDVSKNKAGLRILEEGFACN